MESLLIYVNFNLRYCSMDIETAVQYIPVKETKTVNKTINVQNVVL